MKIQKWYEKVWNNLSEVTLGMIKYIADGSGTKQMPFDTSSNNIDWSASESVASMRSAAALEDQAKVEKEQLEEMRRQVNVMEEQLKEVRDNNKRSSWIASIALIVSAIDLLKPLINLLKPVFSAIIAACR